MNDRCNLCMWCLFFVWCFCYNSVTVVDSKLWSAANCLSLHLSKCLFVHVCWYSECVSYTRLSCKFSHVNPDGPEAYMILARDCCPRDDCCMTTKSAAMQEYEPYVLVSKKLVPWYDERFTGYLQNKMVHVQTMVYMNFTFEVHPSAFAVHYPHQSSQDKELIIHSELKHEVIAAFVPDLWMLTAAFQLSLLP